MEKVIDSLKTNGSKKKKKKPKRVKEKTFRRLMLKYLETNKNKKTYQNLWDASKSGARREFYSSKCFL